VKNISCGPTGGTDQSCIFNDAKSKFESSDIVALITDGDIDQNAVTRFASNLNKYLNKTLFICIIVGKNKQQLLNLNVSVIAPMMVAANCLCLYHDCDLNKSKVIASKGFISNTYRNPTTENDIVTIDPTILRSLKCDIVHIPTDYFVLSETDTYYRAINKKNMLDCDVIQNLTDSELETLIKHATVTNTLTIITRID